MVTFQFVPFTEVQALSSAKRIHKLINIVKNNKIVIMEGRLRRQEEADLIELTMEEIGPSFSGIELSVINPKNKNLEGFEWFKSSLANVLLGDRQGLTVVGPASIVKKIVSNPTKIELFTKDISSSSLKSTVRKNKIKKKRTKKRKKKVL